MAGTEDVKRASRSTNSGLLVPSRRRAAVAVVVAVLVAVGVGLLIGKAAGFAKVRDLIDRADSRWFLVCFLAEVVAFAGYAVVVRDSARWRGGPDVGFRLGAHVTLASLGATRVVAAAGAGGLAVTYWCFRRAGFAKRDAWTRVLGLNTLIYLPFAVGAWTAALLGSVGILGDAPLSMALPWLLAVPLCIAAARYVTEPGRVERLSRSRGWFGRRALAYGIAGTAWVRSLLSDPGGRRALVAAAAYWAGDIVCLWAALRSIGVDVGAADVVLAYATGYVAMVLPLPFAGVGGVDAAMTYALTALGVPLAPALVSVAVYRLFGFWVPTIPAVVALVLLPRAGRKLEEVAEGHIAVGAAPAS